MSDYPAVSRDFSQDDEKLHNGLPITKIGLALIIAGFGAVLFTWLQIKDIQNEAAQIPYIVSGGLIGLGLMVMGAIAHFASEVELGGSSKAELRSLQAQVRALSETSDWTADAIEKIAEHLNDTADSGSGKKR